MPGAELRAPLGSPDPVATGWTPPVPTLPLNRLSRESIQLAMTQSNQRQPFQTIRCRNMPVL
jgi:hypothetical protein